MENFVETEYTRQRIRLLSIYDSPNAVGDTPATSNQKDREDMLCQRIFIGISAIQPISR